MAPIDFRFLLNTPLGDWPADVKAQLVDAVEYVPIWPRGSNGESVPVGSSNVIFDYPKHLLFLSGPETRFDVTFTITKDPPTGVTDRKALEDADGELLVLVENFVAHAFTRFQFLVNNQPVRTDGFIDHGLPLWEDFVGCHLREDAKVMMCTSGLDPFYNTFLLNDQWTKGGEKWKAYVKQIWNEKADRGLVVSYRPLIFPLTTGYSHKDTYVVPSMGQQLSVACSFEPDLHNIYTMHGTSAASKGYQISLSSMSLNLAYVRLSPAGEKAISGSPSKGLAQYPGKFIFQHPAHLTSGDRLAIINFPSIVMPHWILIMAYSTDMLDAAKKATDKQRVRPIDHHITEYSLKFNDMDMYVNTLNPGKLANEDMVTNTRRNFYTNPPFGLPVHHDIGLGTVAEAKYSMPHIFIDCTNRAGQPLQTVNPTPDPRKGKLSILLTGKPNGGLRSFYVVTLGFNDCGVIVDKAHKTFTNAFHAV